MIIKAKANTGTYGTTDVQFEASMALNMMNATGDGKFSVTGYGRTEEDARREATKIMIELLNEFNRKYGTNIRIFL